MNKVFSDKAWEDYQYWILQDRKIVKRINQLLSDIERNGHKGIGKPEALRENLQGFWSRRITDEHRLVYSIDDVNVYIAKCRWHYSSS
jgi:toxin YoeB